VALIFVSQTVSYSDPGRANSFYSDPAVEQWRDLQGIARVECERHMSEQVSSKVRYYITSFGQQFGRLAEAVRGHWGIESSLHRVLGVTFWEDDS
jgi:predicted transposase YbfD/YdcC